MRGRKTTTAQNTDHADRTREIARLTHDAAGASVRQMDLLKAKISEINASSADIAKINRLINEIAFQTNLLALNAAVEAPAALNDILAKAGEVDRSELAGFHRIQSRLPAGAPAEMPSCAPRPRGLRKNLVSTQ